MSVATKKSVEGVPSTLNQFWDFADDTRLETEYSTDKNLKYLQSASLEALQAICLQYRYFVRDYPNNVSVLLSKTPYGEFKSLMAEILADELGSGKADRHHLQLWDNFLVSIGVDPNVLDSSIHPKNSTLLAELSKLTTEMPFTYGIGLCGMGGECLCQVYLTAMYKYIKKHPYLVENSDKVDWEFWNIHTGAEDIQHRILVKGAIGRIIESNPDGLDELFAGYKKAKSNWDSFWQNNYDIAQQK